MALVLKNGARGGGSAAWWTGLGCCAGIAVHAVAAVAGLSAVLAASTTVFGIVKWIGAAYLVYLGLSSWWHSFHKDGSGHSVNGRAAAASTRAAAFRQGLLSNLLNPEDRADLSDVVASVRGSGRAQSGHDCPAGWHLPDGRRAVVADVFVADLGSGEGAVARACSEGVRSRDRDCSCRFRRCDGDREPLTPLTPRSGYAPCRAASYGLSGNGSTGPQRPAAKRGHAEGRPRGAQRRLD